MFLAVGIIPTAVIFDLRRTPAFASIRPGPTLGSTRGEGVAGYDPLPLVLPAPVEAGAHVPQPNVTSQPRVRAPEPWVPAFAGTGWWRSGGFAVHLDVELQNRAANSYQPRRSSTSVEHQPSPRNAPDLGPGLLEVKGEQVFIPCGWY